ncbi:hypothetical protein FHU41_001140 [Psychromicrobium silvestre]|uniref:Aminoglycoside phosphotransferase domain-containing protein n=1 Tax=Psychromicrobium silvestre TaxID=1645614 RepID=A0A7Y9LSS2_9MICC|nr:phosphotransferase [Psychromicrobium silvestre]NYE94919.1 hypothetical protein [Psychromicrobium silvestre]
MFDYTSTARRTPWSALPQQLHRSVEAQLGGLVRSVDLAGGGFTPGFAGIVRTDTAEVFVKAAPAAEEWMFRSYAREAEVHAALPAGVPAPALLNAQLLSAGDDDWQLLFFEAVRGGMPGRPWTESQLAAVESSLLATEEALSAQPPTLKFGSLSAEFVSDSSLREVYHRPLPSFSPALSAQALLELDALMDLAPQALAGTSLQHNDLRPDNILMQGDRALFCDWNFLCFGPLWADWVVMLAYARIGGLDAESWLRRSALSSNADPEQIDSWLATLAAYFLDAGAKPIVANSPRLREHGQFSARMLLDWLIERRHWR